MLCSGYRQWYQSPKRTTKKNLCRTVKEWNPTEYLKNGGQVKSKSASIVIAFDLLVVVFFSSDSVVITISRRHHRRPSLFNPISCVSRLIYAVLEAKREKEIIINRRAELVPFAPDRLTLFTPPVAIRWPKPFFHQDIRRHASRPAGHLTKHPLNTTTSIIRDKTIVQ